MIPPSDKTVFEARMAVYWFENGILVSLSKSVLRTVELIRENVELVKKITGNRRVPLLIYLADSLRFPTKKPVVIQYKSCRRFIPPWRWFQSPVFLVSS